MRKGEMFFYRNTEVEILEIDIEFDLVLVKCLSNEKRNYISSKLLTYIPAKENFISIRLLKGDKKWY